MSKSAWKVVAVLALGVSLLAFLSVERRQGWPSPDAPSYTQLAERLADGDGYTVDIPGEPEGSRYPPGFPLLLALLSPMADPGVATLILAAAFVITVWCSAWTVGGPVAAAVAVLSLAVFLPRHQFAGAVMADVTGALFVVLSLLAMQHNRRVLAGSFVGLGVWVKLAHAACALALPKRAFLPFFVACAGLLATKLAWSWGYSDGHAQWGVQHLWSTDGLTSPQDEQFPNVVAYPLMILGLHGGLVLPGAAVVAAATVWRRPERRFVLVTAGGLLAVYLPYFFQDDRFLFPLVAIIAVYSGAGIAQFVAPATVPDSPRPDSPTQEERFGLGRSR